jgi:DNA excision repair protein ERCC-2
MLGALSDQSSDQSSKRKKAKRSEKRDDPDLTATNSKIIRMAIRDFALPAPRTGSIDSNSGYGKPLQDGIEIHQRIQQKRAREDDRYQSEVKIKAEFDRGGYRFVVEGRIDGLFDHEVPKIEEIKSTFNIFELAKILNAADVNHPYSLQLLTYGYFYYLEHRKIPELLFHLVSTRNFETRDVECRLDLEIYGNWLNTRLDELVLEAERAEKRSKRRKKIASKFPFPFEKPRSGQVELIETIEQAMSEGKRMLVQAPTGLGKTAGVLYPALKEALARGQRVIYVTPKNSQHTVAEDAVERFQETGSALKSLTITAKSKMCMKAEPLCNPTYCEYARNYYDKVAENDLVQVMSKKKKLTSKAFIKVAEEFEVCPFYLQLDSAAEADTVICDYNYVFSPGSALGRIPQLSFAQEGKPNLVIDEAHNLPARAMGYYSPALSAFVLEKMRDDFKILPKRFRTEAEELLDECINVVVACRPDGAPRAMQIQAPLEPFVEQDGKLRGYLSRYLDSDAEIKPKDPVLRLCFYWGEFSDILQQIAGAHRPEFFTTYQPDRIDSGRLRGGTIKITCCDASEMLKPTYDDYDQVVGFSATLKPFPYYSRLSGLDSERLKIAEFKSPFEKSHRKILIIPQISTKFSDRERNYARIAETISRIAMEQKGNYLAFFPSFDFLERVLKLFQAPPAFNVIRQERFMKNAETEDVLQSLKEGGAPTVLFAVQGGVFSEGVDYPGKMVIGAFIVGPPLPNFDVEREGMRKYYDEHYQEGFDYAYAYPAMAKAVQAAGRVIRSETDHGVIVLMDGRFLEKSYTQTMPGDWFTDSARELVSQSILKDVREFWEKD